MGVLKHTKIYNLFFFYVIIICFFFYMFSYLFILNLFNQEIK